MYIYFDKNGTLKEIIADIPARKGSNDYNKIYVYLEGKTQDDISDIWYKQQFPDGTQSIEVSIKDNLVTKAIPYDKDVDMKFFQDYVEYPFYYISLNSSYLAQNGLNLATIRVVIGNEIFAQGMITFNVETNVVVKDTDITQSQYDYLVTNLSAKVDKQSSSGDWEANIYNENGSIYLKSEENDERSDLTLEGSVGVLQSRVDTDHKGYVTFVGGNASLYSLVGDYENEIVMNETNFYIQRKDVQDNLVIHKIDLANGTIDDRPFNYSDVKRYQITNYTSGATEYNFTQTGIDTNNLVAFRLVFNTVDATKNLLINSKNVRLSTNSTSNATMGMLKSFKEEGANAYDFYAFYNGTYFYVINQNVYDKDVTMTHITLGSLTGTLSTSLQQSISDNGIETLFNVTAYNGLLPILFRPYQISSGVYSYRSVTPLEDVGGSYWYEGSINLNDGTYDLSTKKYVFADNYYTVTPAVDVTPLDNNYPMEITLGSKFKDVLEGFKQDILLDNTLLTALGITDYTKVIIKPAFIEEEIVRTINGNDVNCIPYHFTMFTFFNNFFTEVIFTHDTDNNKWYMYLNVFNDIATVEQLNALEYDLENNTVMKNDLQFTSDSQGNLTQIEYDNAIYTVSGGSQLYQHNIHYTYLPSSAYVYKCNATIISSLSSITRGDLAKYLYDNGFRTADNVYNANGAYYSSPDFYNIYGIYSTNGTSLFFAMIKGGTVMSVSFSLSNGTYIDTAIQL